MAIKNTVSMQELANELGISKVTVSKALNGKDGVSSELKKKIYETAEKYGYVLPNYGKRKTKKIGIIMGERFNTGNEGRFYIGMCEKIISEFRKYMYSSLMITPNRDTLENDFKALTDPVIFDGLIFLGILDPEIKKKFSEIDVPKVYVDVYDERHQSDSVVTENIYSTYDITDYLIQNGHNDIGFVGTIGSTTSITDRYLGYIRRLIENGVKPKDEWIIPDRDENGVALELKLPNNLPTAFVCNCDETAFELIKVLKSKGIKVPEDISVVGFDNSIYATICEPPLTTVAVNMEKIGQTTVQCINKCMNNRDKKGGEVFRVPGRIIYRSSVREIKEGKECI